MNKPPLSRRHLLRLGAVLASAPAALAWGQESYPVRPIRLIVPFAPGGATDVVARILAQKLPEVLGQAVVVDNRPGANGLIGTEAVARAAPDGYTLLLNTAGAQTLSPLLYKANFDPLKSFAPISLLASIGLVVVVNPAVPASSMQEFVALARARGRSMSMSTGSSMIELIEAQLKSVAGIPEVVSVPYKGTGPQLAAVVSGEADLTVDPFTGLQLIKTGKLRPLAVLSATRSPALPHVPTMEEAGFPGMNFMSWAGLLAPAGTPAAITSRLHQAVTRVLAQPEVRRQFAALDYEVLDTGPEQLSETIASDLARWAALIKSTGYSVKP